MARIFIDTGPRFCTVCGESFYRQKYRSGRYEEPGRFEDRNTCGKPECVEEYQSMIAKEVWRQRKKTEPQDRAVTRTVTDAWLSGRYNQSLSVRYKRKD